MRAACIYFREVSIKGRFNNLGPRSGFLIVPNFPRRHIPSGSLQYKIIVVARDEVQEVVSANAIQVAGKQLTRSGKSHSRPGQSESGSNIGDMKGEEIAAGGVGDHLKEALQEVTGGEDLVGFTAQNSLSERGHGMVGDMKVFIELAE